MRITIKTEQVALKICVYTYMHVIIINEKRGYEFKIAWRWMGVYGAIWKGEREGRNVIISQ